MSTRLNPYINFTGNTREAMEFYKSIFGGKLDMNNYGEFNMGGEDGSQADKIMHAQLEADNGIMFMASDTPEGMPHQEGTTISMSLSGENEEEIRGYWDKLSEGGTVTMPFEKAPWGDTFGMLTDKFNIRWMVNLNSKQA